MQHLQDKYNGWMEVTRVASCKDGLVKQKKQTDSYIYNSSLLKVVSK